MARYERSFTLPTPDAVGRTRRRRDGRRGPSRIGTGLRRRRARTVPAGRSSSSTPPDRSRAGAGRRSTPSATSGSTRPRTDGRSCRVPGTPPTPDTTAPATDSDRLSSTRRPWSTPSFGCPRPRVRPTASPRNCPTSTGTPSESRIRRPGTGRRGWRPVEGGPARRARLPERGGCRGERTAVRRRPGARQNVRSAWLQRARPARNSGRRAHGRPRLRRGNRNRFKTHPGTRYRGVVA